MANGGGCSLDNHCVFVETNINTRLALQVHHNETISDFKEKVCKEHKQLFPQVGEINVSAMKVKRGRQFFYLSDSMIISMAYEGITKTWFMYADAVRVDGELLAIMDVDPSGSYPKETSTGSEGHPEDLSIEEKTKVKKTKKRKVESSDGNESRKKPTLHLNLFVVSPREKLDDILMGAMGKEIESGHKNGISMEENKQSSEADRLCQGKNLTVISKLVDGHSRGDVKDVAANKSLEEALETDLAMRKSNVFNESHTSDGNVPIEKLDDFRGAKEHDNERCEEGRLAPSAEAKHHAAELVTYPENQLDSSNLTTGPATEKKKKRKKSSKGHINQSAATTTSNDIVNADPISRRETLENPLVEAIQKEIEMNERSVEYVGRDKMETENLVDHLENHLDTTGGLTTSPVIEKKKRRKKNSKDHINQSSCAAAGTTSSREIVNEIKGVLGNVDHVDAIPESFPVSGRSNPIAEARQRENEIEEKIDDNVGGSGKDIPTAADNIQTGNFVSDLENQLEASRILATIPGTQKKRKHKKSSKDQISQSAADTTTSRKIVNKREKVYGSIGRVDVSSESLAYSKGEKHADTLVDAVKAENEVGDKFVDNVGLVDNLQVADFASTPVQESKTLDNIGKLKDENIICEHEVAKDNNDIDAGEAKALKTTKKKKSKKAKTLAKEDTLVPSGAHIVEPIIKVVDGEEPDNVIRNVLDSLQQKNETEENLERVGKKSSKKSKKKDSMNIVEARVLSVDINNTAHQEVPLISIPKETDVSFTPAKKDIESHLKMCVEVAGNTEDNNSSKQILEENADIGDNFGSSQNDIIVDDSKKQDQVTGGIIPKKEKKSLDVHPGGSIDGSLSSMKPKERKGRVQPANSGTSHLQSGAKSDRNELKVDCYDASTKGAVDNKKKAVMTNSNKTMNFFKDTEWDTTEYESNKTASDVSTKSPSDSSSDEDSDMTSMSRKQGNNLSGGTKMLSGSLRDILRSSRSFKMAKLRASQSQPGIFDDDSPTLDCVPDSQAN